MTIKEKMMRNVTAILVKHGLSLELARQASGTKDRSKNYEYVGNGNKAKRRAGWVWKDYRCPHNVGGGDCACEGRGFYTDDILFANEGSALRVATVDNPRNLPCPECGCEDVLTPQDAALGYRCDECADRAEYGY